MQQRAPILWEDVHAKLKELHGRPGGSARVREIAADADDMKLANGTQDRWRFVLTAAKAALLELPEE